MPSSHIFTSSFYGQGLLFVYIFTSFFFLLIRFLDDIKAYVCILSICLSSSFFSVIKELTTYQWNDDDVGSEVSIYF